MNRGKGERAFPHPLGVGTKEGRDRNSDKERKKELFWY